MSGSRIAFALLACLGLCAFSNGKYSIKFPPGFEAAESINEAESGVQSNGPASAGKVWCRANSVPLPAIGDLTQQQINEEFRAPLDHETWAGFMGVDAAKFSESQPRVRLVAGHLVQEATFDFADDVLGFPARARWSAHILPGRVVNGVCFAATLDYERNRPSFEAALASLRPL